MSYTTTKTILKYASDHSIAHPAFNVNMPCQAEAIIEACEEIRSACIIQVAEPGLAFIGGNPDFLNGTMEEKKREKEAYLFLERNTNLIKRQLKGMIQRQTLDLHLFC